MFVEILSDRFFIEPLVTIQNRRRLRFQIIPLTAKTWTKSILVDIHIKDEPLMSKRKGERGKALTQSIKNIMDSQKVT